jgi:hypothetical protein
MSTGVQYNKLFTILQLAMCLNLGIAAAILFFSAYKKAKQSQNGQRLSRVNNLFQSSYL